MPMPPKARADVHATDQSTDCCMQRIALVVVTHKA